MFILTDVIRIETLKGGIENRTPHPIVRSNRVRINEVPLYSKLTTGKYHGTSDFVFHIFVSTQEILHIFCSFKICIHSGLKQQLVNFRYIGES